MFIVQFCSVITYIKKPLKMNLRLLLDAKSSPLWKGWLLTNHSRRLRTWFRKSLPTLQLKLTRPSKTWNLSLELLREVEPPPLDQPNTPKRIPQKTSSYLRPVHQHARENLSSSTKGRQTEESINIIVLILLVNPIYNWVDYLLDEVYFMNHDLWFFKIIC